MRKANRAGKPNSFSDTTQFHILDFDRRDEAAAFVAALSRVLNSPRGSAYLSENVQVWAEVTSRETVRLLLSDGALEAAQSAFSPVRVTGAVGSDFVSHGHLLIIEGGETPAWGLVEAQLQLPDNAKDTSSTH